jgi:hypothetical protein
MPDDLRQGARRAGRATRGVPRAAVGTPRLRRQTQGTRPLPGRHTDPVRRRGAAAHRVPGADRAHIRGGRLHRLGGQLRVAADLPGLGAARHAGRALRRRPRRGARRGALPGAAGHPTERGFVVNGRWKFGSGCKAADIICVGIPGDAGKPRGALLRPSQAEIVEDGDVVGMQGTDRARPAGGLPPSGPTPDTGARHADPGRCPDPLHVPVVRRRWRRGSPCRRSRWHRRGGSSSRRTGARPRPGR